ncbi:MAG: phage major capsid protein [Clostridia bacterium]|nr:phage major capsid protein [Clostridia bacterium]
MDSVKNLLTAEEVLKDVYLPYWNNQIGIKPSPFIAKIKKVTVASDNIVAGAPIGISGGFGYSSEGLGTPAAGHALNKRFTAHTKDMYVNLCISQKAVELGTTKGAMKDQLAQEVESAYDAANWNVGRSAFGNGKGILTNVTALSTPGNIVTVSDVKNLKEGITVDFYETGALVGSTPALTRRIIAIDRENNKIVIDGAKTTVSAGFITIQKSYGKEITGVGSIFDDSITELYGVNKADNLFLKPIVETANNDIRDGVITKALRRSSRDKNGNVDMILCGDKAYDAYTTYLRESNIRIEDRTGTVEGGFKSIQFMFGNRLVDIVNESFIPDSEMWGVDTSAFELHQTGWKFSNLRDAGIFNLMENQSVYRALLYNYAELICKNPGSCIKITNVA